MVPTFLKAYETNQKHRYMAQKSSVERGFCCLLMNSLLL